MLNIQKSEKNKQKQINVGNIFCIFNQSVTLYFQKRTVLIQYRLLMGHTPAHLTHSWMPSAHTAAILGMTCWGLQQHIVLSMDLVLLGMLLLQPVTVCIIFLIYTLQLLYLSMSSQSLCRCVSV